MAARNKSKAEEAITKLKGEGLAPGNGEVIWLELDLSDPRNAKKTAQEFLNKETRLDVLSKATTQTLATPIIDFIHHVQSTTLPCTCFTIHLHTR
jgi:NAD(P)-dependent dehydrogenase (short-subunit alcohol dehydrogenase family)